MSLAVPPRTGESRPASWAIPQDLTLLAPTMGVVALYIAGVWLSAQIGDLTAFFSLDLYIKAAAVSLWLAGPIWLLVYFGHMSVVAREPHPIARIARDVRRHVLSLDGLLTVFLALVAVPLFFSAFSSLKVMIPHIHPFSLDAAFAEIDRILHFGVAPWRLTHAVFGADGATMAINFVYNSWIFVVWIFLFCHVFWLTGPVHRARYLLTFFLCWVVIGSVMAVLLSSAGPCYYGRVVEGPDLFAPLMDRLATIDARYADAVGYWRLWALDTQEMLWRQYQAGASQLGSGISAMPSMHVSMAVLMALSAWRIARGFGWAMWAYAGFVLIGSVHLGWHYAIDGYIAAAATFLLWRLSGRIVAAIGTRTGAEAPP